MLLHGMTAGPGSRISAPYWRVLIGRGRQDEVRPSKRHSPAAGKSHAASTAAQGQRHDVRDRADGVVFQLHRRR